VTSLWRAQILKNLCIYPLFLCGGAGTRLWPVSRQSSPKQFLSINSDKSLIDEAFARTAGLPIAVHTLIASREHEDLVSAVIERIATPVDVFLEPSMKNTAPAAILGCLSIYEKDPDAIVLIMPTDHHISPVAEFERVIQDGISSLAKDQTILFGIKPTHPTSAYGYIKVNTHVNGSKYEVCSFVEKPDVELASKLIAGENAFWNSGIFLLHAETLLSLAKVHQPILLQDIEKIFLSRNTRKNWASIGEESWSKISGGSLDQLIFEKAKNLKCIEYRGEWSDLGDWNSVAKLSDSDHDGNNLSGNVTAIDCKSSSFFTTDDTKHLLTIGLEDILAVCTHDALLIAQKDNLHKMKYAVPALIQRGVSQATTNSVVQKPWGSFQVILKAENFQIKVLNVKPGARLSLQSHNRRSEHWVVTKGVATVTVGSKKSDLMQDFSVYIETGEVHRLANETKDEVIVVEVQIGDYLGEDDIIRYEDDYDRIIV
jgi:mannose-1-phosphate guanylyltransferase/mannose-6-phosphate isomerase